MNEFKPGKSIQVIFFVAISLLSFNTFVRAESQRQEVAVNVGVNRNGEVQSIQVGNHGRHLTRSQILNNFDTNRNGAVTLGEFRNSNKLQGWNVSPQNCNINLGSGTNRRTAEQMLSYMDNASQYLAQHNLTFSPPGNINLGDNGAGDYASDGSWNLSTTSGSEFQEVVTSKTIQQSLNQNYPNLGYQANEAFSRYLTYDCLGIENYNGGNNTYNPQTQSMTGNDIANAYRNYNNGLITREQLNQIIANTTNNNLALFQAMLSYGNSDAAFNALRILSNTSNPDGEDIRDAYMRATNGSDSSGVNTSFNRHGI